MLSFFSLALDIFFLFSFKDIVGHAVTFIPFEETDVGQVTVKSSNIYQIQLQLKPEEW